MTEPITFFDMPRNVPPGEDPSEIVWSFNTIKTRLALNIKGLPFKTEWVSFIDIEPRMKALGITRNSVKVPYRVRVAGGNEKPYTVPTIIDPSTGAIVNESLEIAKYLDKQYPDTPTLVPPGTAAFQAAFVDAYVDKLMESSFPLLMMVIFNGADVANQAYFRGTREPFFGCKLEDVEPKGAAREAMLKEFERLLDDAARWITHAGEDAVFLTGQTPSHADTAIYGILIWVIRCGGKNHELSKIIERACGGKWKKYMEVFAQWMDDH